MNSALRYGKLAFLMIYKGTSLFFVTVFKPSFHQQDHYEPDLSWNKPVDTEDYDLAWIPKNSPTTTTSGSPVFPSSGIRSTAADSGLWQITADPVPWVRSTQHSQVLSHSEETAHHRTLTRPPEVMRGSSDFSSSAPFYSTTQGAFISTATAPNTRTEVLPGGSGSDDYSEVPGSVSTTNPTFTDVSSATSEFSTIGESSTTSSSAETDQGVVHPVDKETTTHRDMFAEREDSPEDQDEILTSQAVTHRPTGHVPHFSPTTGSVQLSGGLLQTTYPLSNGERLSVLPYSSFTSSPLCDTADPGLAPSTCLHDPPSSSRPLLSTAASDSRHVAATDSASPPTPSLIASTLPHLPPPLHPQSETNPVSSGFGFDDSDSSGEMFSGSYGDPSLFNTPPLQNTPPGTTFTSEPSASSWDPSLSTVSLSFSLQPSVLLTNDFSFSISTPDLSQSFSAGFEDSRFATGSTIESFLPEGSGDGFPLASDVDPICGCSLEPSVPSPWLHTSPHVPSSGWDSVSLALSPSVPSASSAGTDGLPHSLVVSRVLSSDQPLVSHSSISPSLSSSHSHVPQVTYTDLPVSVSATAGISEFLPSSPILSLLTPAPEAWVLDASSSASGSALFPESQEGVDQEWDRVQISGSGESGFPYSTKATNTDSPSATSGSGQNPDDLDERSSAFYFESESRSTAEVGDTVTPPATVVTSVFPWPLGGEEESGSGQGENETSSDFSISERTERESEEEEPVAGKRVTHCGQKGVTPGVNPPSTFNKTSSHI